jgi:hypothetical protein
MLKTFLDGKMPLLTGCKKQCSSLKSYSKRLRPAATRVHETSGKALPKIFSEGYRVLAPVWAPNPFANLCF